MLKSLGFRGWNLNFFLIFSWCFLMIHGSNHIESLVLAGNMFKRKHVLLKFQNPKPMLLDLFLYFYITTEFMVPIPIPNHSQLFPNIPKHPSGCGSKQLFGVITGTGPVMDRPLKPPKPSRSWEDGMLGLRWPWNVELCNRVNQQWKMLPSKNWY